MAYVITDACVKDFKCVEKCLKKAIHPTKNEEGWEAVPQLYINPKRCQDCGTCATVCVNNAIFPADELPDDKVQFKEINAAYFRKRASAA